MPVILARRPGGSQEKVWYNGGMKLRSIHSILWLTTLLAVTALRAFAADPPGLSNFHTTAPGIYRGGAPTRQGFEHLKAMGVHTIIDLRIAPRTVRKEGILARSMGFEWINLPMGSEAPTAHQVATFLATLKRAPQQPVYVHCQHGADRTGCMIGIWRVTQDGWTFRRAYAEMRRYGFNPRWTKLSGAVRQRAKASSLSR
jgi:tyrosine-protein phosphatase SIW14